MSKQFDHARRASTGLSWGSSVDRVFIANNLLVARDELLEQGESTPESEDRLHRLSRVQDRLAVCEMVRAREFRAQLAEQEAARDARARAALNMMVHGLKLAVLQENVRWGHFEWAKASALELKDRGLMGRFRTGRYAALAELAVTVAEMDVHEAVKMYHAIYEVMQMVNFIEPETRIDDDDPSSTAWIFKKGHRLLRRELKLDKESGRA